MKAVLAYASSFDQRSDSIAVHPYIQLRMNEVCESLFRIKIRARSISPIKKQAIEASY